MILFTKQKESMNLMSNLRATNDLIIPSMTENVPTITETKDEGGGEVTSVLGGLGSVQSIAGGTRQRRKIERNTSAPLPGMLQVVCMQNHICSGCFMIFLNTSLCSLRTRVSSTLTSR